METYCRSFELIASPQVPIRITTDVPSGLVRTILLGAASSHLVLALARLFGLQPKLYRLEGGCIMLLCYSRICWTVVLPLASIITVRLGGFYRAPPYT